MAAPFRALRPLTTQLATRPTRTAAAATVRNAGFFHTSNRLLVKPGDAVPNLGVLMENSPGTKVNLADEFGRGIIIGVPAAFSPACSSRHVPGYMKHPGVKKIIDAGGKVVVVSVNDVFVMKAWQDRLDPGQKSGIRFLADPSGTFTEALDLGFDDAAPIFGGMRGKRYALVIEDGKVKSCHVELDNTGTSVSLAENVLG